MEEAVDSPKNASQTAICLVRDDKLVNFSPQMTKTGPEF